MTPALQHLPLNWVPFLAPVTITPGQCQALQTDEVKGSSSSISITHTYHQLSLSHKHFDTSPLQKQRQKKQCTLITMTLRDQECIDKLSTNNTFTENPPPIISIRAFKKQQQKQTSFSSFFLKLKYLVNDLVK